MEEESNVEKESQVEKKSYDLSEFIMGGEGGEGCETLLISDFEGTTPFTHLLKFKEYCKGAQGKRVIFLGDVFDNTAQSGTYCTGEECIDPDEEDGNCVSNVNYCALQTIQTLVDDGKKNCRYVVGNRDINKIKLLPFFSLRNGKKWWTEGESYEEIVKKLLETLAYAKEKKTNPWLVQGKENLKYFKPFWKEQAMHKNQQWNNDVIDIYDRFELIFGKDPDKGTMSALVTLKCIPNEIYAEAEKKMLDFYKSVKEKDDYTIVKCPQDLKNIVESKKDIKAELAKEANADWLKDVTWRKQVRAALTLTIFMRMLDKDLLVKERKSIFLNELGTLDGYLYKYLTDAPAAYYAYYNHTDTDSDNKKDLFLFAHGGLTNAFIKEKGLKGIENVKKELTYWDEKLKQSGGEGEITDVGMAITNYNEGYAKLVNNFFNMRDVLKRLDAQKFTDPSIKKYWLLPMLSLLKLSAGDYPKPNDERGSTSYYPNQAKEPSDSIFADIHTEGNVYNIFGHASASSFYSFGQARVKDDPNDISGRLLEKIEEGKNKTYFLSTDFSTTLFKTGIVCNKESDGLYDKNYLLCILDTTKGELEIGIDGNITLNINNYQFKPYNDFKTIDANLANEKKSTIFHKKEGESSKPSENTSKITLNFDKNDNLLEKIAKVDEYNGTKYLKYNGIATVSNTTVNPNNEDTKYYIYSSRFVKINEIPLPYSIVLVPVSEIETESKIVEEPAQAGGRRQLKKRHHRKTKKGGRKTHKRRAAKKRATKKKAARRKTKRMY